MTDKESHLEVFYHFKDMEPSEAIKNYAAERSQKVKKFVQKNGTLKWSFEVDTNDHKASCHFVTESWNDYCDAVSPDLYQTIDLAIDKLVHVVQKQKEKMKSHN